LSQGRGELVSPTVITQPHFGSLNQAREIRSPISGRYNWAFTLPFAFILFSVEGRRLKAAEWGVRSAEWGVRSAEWGVRSAEWGVRSAEWGVRSAEWGIPDSAKG
jgi:hypothetical protein